jgi:ribonuclease HI
MSALDRRRAASVLAPDEILERYHDGPTTGVFTDGSCEGNPGPGGWGFAWVEDDQVRLEKWGSDPATTNNRMELTALLEAYRALPHDASVTVYSDSQLCVNTVNVWAAGWKRNGWRRKGGPIANLDLVRQLYEEAARRSGVRLQWIRAHDGSRWNEYVDSLATTYMRMRERR